MSKYKFSNGFIYCNGLRMSMTEVVAELNEMSAKLHEKDREYKDLFEAFEDGQKVLEDANKRLENLSKVNKEYKMKNLNLNNLLQPTEPSPVKLKMPDEGEKVLALYKGEWVILQVGVEHPTYEESFTAFKYWFEPMSEMLDIELDDVTYWEPLPEIPTKEQENG